MLIYIFRITIYFHTHTGARAPILTLALCVYILSIFNIISMYKGAEFWFGPASRHPVIRYFINYYSLM